MLKNWTGSLFSVYSLQQMRVYECVCRESMVWMRFYVFLHILFLSLSILLIFYTSVIILSRAVLSSFLPVFFCVYPFMSTWIHKNIFKTMSIMLWIWPKFLFEILKLLPLETSSVTHSHSPIIIASETVTAAAASSKNENDFFLRAAQLLRHITALSRISIAKSSYLSPSRIRIADTPAYARFKIESKCMCLLCRKKI